MLGAVLTFCTLPFAPVLPPRAAAVDTVPIQEWLVPWPGTRPRDPFVDRDGRIWFVGQQGDYLGLFNDATGQFRRFPLPNGAGPHNVVQGPDGAMWYTGNRQANLGRLDPATGTITSVAMPNGEPGDPHTLVFDATGIGWFTAQQGNVIARFDPQTGVVRLVPVPIPGARPYGIVVDSRNRPWIATFGTNAIATIDPETMTLRLFPLPNERARPRRVAVTSNDMVWYVDYSRGFLAQLDPASGAVREWAAPSGAASLPYALAADHLDRLWFVETGPRPNRLVGFDPKTEQFFGVTAIPSGGGSVRHMVFHQPTRSLWFGTDVNTIGRAVVP